MCFSLAFNPISCLLLGLGLLFALIFAVWHWSRTVRLKRQLRYEDERDYAEELQPVSVIVYACNDADWLSRFLPMMLEQDYPEFEVIVVNDGSTDGTRDLLSDMKTGYPHLHVTFTPMETRGLSRKKLALMIGVKAAKYDVVLTTNANCRAMSPNWLATMMRNFTPEVGVVIGYSHYRYSKDKGLGRGYRVFDTVTVASQYLNSAIKGRPYRGTCDNLAYRKKLFFDNNGFSKSMDLRWGDDDVFLSVIATRTNTRVEIAPESQLVAYYDNVASAHKELKLRRDFTSRFVRRTPFVVQGLMSLVYYMQIGALAAAVAFDYRNAFVLIAAVAILLLSWLSLMISFNHSGRVLQVPGLVLSPVYALWRPVVNFVYKLHGQRSKSSNYTSMLG